jgi:hypothetical protein
MAKRDQHGFLWTKGKQHNLPMKINNIIFSIASMDVNNLQISISYSKNCGIHCVKSKFLVNSKSQHNILELVLERPIDYSANHSRLQCHKFISYTLVTHIMVLMVLPKFWNHCFLRLLYGGPP